jgi:hypothetical protein
MSCFIKIDYSPIPPSVYLVGFPAKILYVFPVITASSTHIVFDLIGLTLLV